MKSQKRVAFLLGAGTSVAVGMPSTEEITKEILSQERLNKTKKIIRMIPNPSILDKFTIEEECFTQEGLEFIQHITNYIKKYNTHTRYVKTDAETTGYGYGRIKKREINYEDLIYISGEIYKHLITDVSIYGSILYENAFYGELNEKYSRIFNTSLKDFVHNQVLPYLRHSLEDILIERQQRSVMPFGKLDLIVNAINDKDVKLFNIFTLNHDTIAENLLELNKIKYCDGFEPDDNSCELRTWNPELFEMSETNNHIRLLKIHGSIGWNSFKPLNQDRKWTILGIYTGKKDIYREHTVVKDAYQNEYRWDDGPHFLSGTENKIHAYFHLPYYEIFSRFRKILFNEVDVIISCGYSFGDSPINGQLVEWLFYNRDDENKEMIVIDKESELYFPEKLDQDLRERFLRSPDRDKIKYKASIIEDVSWESIKAYL